MEKGILIIDCILVLLIIRQLYIYYTKNKCSSSRKTKKKVIKLKSIEHFIKKKNKFPKIIYQTWKTRTLPKNFQVWSSTWKENHPKHKYLMWTDKNNRDFIKNNYSDFLETYDNYNQNIKRVDAVRYFFLYHYGGIYADLDFESLKPLDPILKEFSDYDVILGRMGINEEFAHSIPNAIMISKPRADFWLYVIENMKKRANQDGAEYDTGPMLLKYCVDTYRGPSKIKVLSTDYLYPINWAINEGVQKGLI